jgi:hypothetical protein
MTTVAGLDTGQAMKVVDGRGHHGVYDYIFAPPLHWRLAVQVVAIDLSAALRNALRLWLPRTAVALYHFHLISLAQPRPLPRLGTTYPRRDKVLSVDDPTGILQAVWKVKEQLRALLRTVPILCE